MSSAAIGQESSRLRAWRERLPRVLAAVGSIVLLAATFAPWYRVGHAYRSAWQESPIVLALLLAVILAGGALAVTTAAGRSVDRRTLVSIFGLTLVATLAVVFRLFIDRPGGNGPAAVAFGGYPALLGINLVKASAVAMLARARQRRAAVPRVVVKPAPVWPSQAGTARGGAAGR